MSEKTKPSELTRKRRRIIPTREAGAPKDLLYSNPADDLFAEAFGKSFLDDEALDNLTSETQIADSNSLSNQTPNLGHTSLEISDTRENISRTHELEISDTCEDNSRTHELKNLGHTSLYCFNGIHGEPILVRLKVLGITSRIFAEPSFYPSQKIIKTSNNNKENSLTVELFVAEGRGLERFILSWMPDIEVISPKNLREKIKEILLNSSGNNK